MSAVELIRHLQLEADELRKQKKRQNVTGLHKSVQHTTPLHTDFPNQRQLMQQSLLLNVLLVMFEHMRAV